MTDNDLSTCSNEVLEHECVTLAAEIAASMCRWLLVIAELDRREAWGSWGCKSMAHWLSWRCSLSMRTAHEHVRVATALTALPLMTEAFGRGELSYSKVRALSRVATPDGEAELVELARTATASQLEKIIGATVVETIDPATRDELRALYTGTTVDGMGELRATMRPEELAIVESALSAALRADECSAEQSPPIAARRVDALVRVCESYLATGDGARTGADRTSIVIHAEVDVATGEITAAETDRGAPVPAETAARLSCDATLFTIVHGRLEPIGSGLTTRTPTRAMRRAVYRRSGGACEFVGCQERTYIEIHHVQRWTDDGPTEYWNLAALCWHHHHLVHKAGWTATLDRTTDTLRCFRPDGTELLAPMPVDVEPLERTIDDERIVPLWAGERFDLGACVDAVLAWTQLPDKSN